MKFQSIKFFILVLFFAGSAFAQKGGEYSCVLDPSMPCELPIVLQGPDNKNPGAPIVVRASYQLSDGTITMSVNLQEDQGHPYTHLWFPLVYQANSISPVSVAKYFKLGKGIKVAQKPQFKKVSNQLLSPSGSVSCANGDVVDTWSSDFFLPLKGDKDFTVHVAVKNPRQPITVTLRNIVPLTADPTFTKATLYYIADDISITFQVPSEECLGKMALVAQYERENKELAAGFAEWNNKWGHEKRVSGQNDLLRLYLKYYHLRHPSGEDLKCSELKSGFGDFYKTYSMIESEMVITLDSLNTLIAHTETLIDTLRKAFNYKHTEECKQLKKQAQYYLGITLDKNTYNAPEDKEVMVVHNKVLEFIDKQAQLKRFVDKPCPVIDNFCDVGISKVVEATSDINDLANQIRKQGVDENAFRDIEQRFIDIKSATNEMLSKMTTSCKNKKDNKEKIENYNKAVKLFETRSQSYKKSHNH